MDSCGQIILSVPEARSYRKTICCKYTYGADEPLKRARGYFGDNEFFL